MKSIAAAVVTCAILFGVSYGASSYYTSLEKDDQDSEQVEPAEESAERKSTLPPDEEVVKKSPVSQVAHRPDSSVSLEAVLQMSESIRKMEEKLILRERKVAREEQRIKLLFGDLETEQNELQALSEGVDAKVRALESLAANLQDSLTLLDQRKAELESLEKKAGAEDTSQSKELDNKVNDVKGWFSNLEAEQAADYLKEFANNGKLEFAASLLHKMPDRQKSKILAALNDPTLVSQLIESLKVKPKVDQ